MTIDTGDIIAFLALIASIYAIYQNHKTNQRQAGLFDMEIKLNELLIQKEQEEVVSKLKADIKGRYHKIGTNQHRLKLWNDGLGTAKNVSIDFNGQDGIPLLWDDIESKFPLDMTSKYSVELLAAMCWATPRKHSIFIKWEDETGNDQKKELVLTVP